MKSAHVKAGKNALFRAAHLIQKRCTPDIIRHSFTLTGQRGPKGERIDVNQMVRQCTTKMDAADTARFMSGVERLAEIVLAEGEIRDEEFALHGIPDYTCEADMVRQKKKNAAEKSGKGRFDMNLSRRRACWANSPKVVERLHAQEVAKVEEEAKKVEKREAKADKLAAPPKQPKQKKAKK